MELGKESAEFLVSFLKGIFKRKKFYHAVKDSIKVTGLCVDIVESDMSVDCFLLVMANNGNGKHGFKKYSVINGHANPLTMPNFKLWNYEEIIMDFDHQQLIARICEQKEFGMHISEITGNDLKMAYSFEKIKFTKFYFIRSIKSAMWYIVAGTVDRNEKFDSVDQKARMRMAVNKVKNIVSSY